jgi:hypothetical protein
MLFSASNNTRLEANADIPNYIVMSWDQNAGWSHDINFNDRSVERVEEFKCLGRP